MELYKHYDRWYKVTGKYQDTDEGTKEANAFMEANPGHSVLAVKDGEIILAHKDDKGVRK